VEVCQRIAHALDSLGTLPYDHDGRRSLPARRDALSTAWTVLCHPRGPVAGLGPESEPAMVLAPDGSIEAHFFRGRACLSLKFPCNGVVLLERHHADEQTVVHSEARPGRSEEREKAVAEAFAWLAAQEPGEEEPR
jgi:hypothetical protein